MIHGANVNGKENINFNDFKTMMARKIHQNHLKDLQFVEYEKNELLEAFRVFDQKGNGLICVEMFRHVFVNVGETKLAATIHDIDQLIDEAEPFIIGGRNINYVDFLHHAYTCK
jgi:Ca2+-binding EF-hand superfamily protein